MARFVVDPGVLIRLAGTGLEISDRHELLAPTLARSQVLSMLHEAAQRGELSREDALQCLARVARIPVRLLGDAVLRRRAWEVADRLGWASTYAAEYVALTQLQADAFVTVDTDLARAARALVPIAPIEALRQARPKLQPARG